ncbi:hypothetical protein JCM1393_27590 [Clostridium carnis]
MGFSFRKSIKIGKNTRINLSSKGGVGISTGVKGARVSINKQGAKVYGGKGALRYQKQIYSNSNSKSNHQSSSNNEIYKYEENTRVKKPNFFKRFYKEIIVVLIGITIGSSIGGIGKVISSTVDEVKSEIETNNKTIENKKLELESLQAKKAELEASLGN